MKHAKDQHCAVKALGCNTHSSASGTSHGEVTQTGNLTYPVREVCTTGSTTTALWLSAKNRKPVLQPDPSFRLTPQRFPAFSHQLPGSAPHINQRLPPTWALALAALPLLKKPSQPNALCKGVGHHKTSVGSDHS